MTQYTVSRPAAAGTAALSARAEAARASIRDALKRLLAASIEARMRKAAALVLRPNPILHAAGAERADLVVEAEALRRSLQ